MTNLLSQSTMFRWADTQSHWALLRPAAVKFSRLLDVIWPRGQKAAFLLNISTKLLDKNPRDKNER
jgi:hypothetical protein